MEDKKKQIPSYIKQRDDNLYYCEVCHTIMETFEDIQKHRFDEYHKIKVFELRKRIKQYEEEHNLRKREEPGKNKYTEITTQKKIILDTNEKNEDEYKNINDQKIFEAKENLEFSKTNSENYDNDIIYSNESYLSVAQNQKQNFGNKKLESLKARLALLKESSKK